MSSSVFSALRDRFTVHAVNGFVTAGPAASLLLLGGRLEQANTEEAFHALLVAVRELRTHGPTPAAFEVAKVVLRLELRHAVSSRRSDTESDLPAPT